MADETTDENGQSPEAQEPQAIPFAEFLERVPPSQVTIVEPVAKSGSFNGTDYAVETPEIQLHCSDASCNGTRFYRYAGEHVPRIAARTSRLMFLTYRCSNCQRSVKVFALHARLLLRMKGQCEKLGEMPAYGPPTPARLISLVGAEREIFLKGRRCENQGLGIGAFGYYRRVVEHQKDKIFGEIIRVSEKVRAPAEVIDSLREAMLETQFKSAVGKVKDGIPQVLLIDGQNPLVLLHGALSQGLHAQSDEECLALAQAVRVVLTELSERLATALKDEAELKSAVARLTQAHASKRKKEPGEG